MPLAVNDPQTAPTGIATLHQEAGKLVPGRRLRKPVQVQFAIDGDQAAPQAATAAINAKRRLFRNGSDMWLLLGNGTQMRPGRDCIAVTAITT